MKCNLYEANTGTPLAVAFLAAVNVDDSDAAKAGLSPDELKVFSSLTGYECHKPTVKFGKLKADFCAGGPRQPEHKAGCGVVVAEVANGIRFAVFDPIEPADLLKAAASHAQSTPLDDQTAKAGNAPSTPPSVIVPPVPASGVTDPDPSAEHG